MTSTVTRLSSSRLTWPAGLLCARPYHSAADRECQGLVTPKFSETTSSVAKASTFDSFRFSWQCHSTTRASGSQSPFYRRATPYARAPPSRVTCMSHARACKRSAWDLESHPSWSATDLAKAQVRLCKPWARILFGTWSELVSLLSPSQMTCLARQLKR